MLIATSNISRLNPYFIGLPILIILKGVLFHLLLKSSQSLFYWITYSYEIEQWKKLEKLKKVSILILLDYLFLYTWIITKTDDEGRLNPYFIGLPILIWKLCRYEYRNFNCLNPYFIGLPILIGAIEASIRNQKK